MLDGAHAVGLVPVDVKEIGCDYYSGCGHKWLMAPQGTGFLYVNKDRLDELQITWLGAATATLWDLENLDFEAKTDADKFEYGTRDLTVYGGLAVCRGHGAADRDGRDRGAQRRSRGPLETRPGQRAGPGDHDTYGRAAEHGHSRADPGADGRPRPGLVAVGRAPIFVTTGCESRRPTSRSRKRWTGLWNCWRPSGETRHECQRVVRLAWRVRPTGYPRGYAGSGESLFLAG